MQSLQQKTKDRGEKKKRTHMHCDIVELTNQLGRQVRVIGNVSIDFFVSSGSNLQQEQEFQLHFFAVHFICSKSSHHEW